MAWLTPICLATGLLHSMTMKGDAVDKDHDVRAVCFFKSLYPELIDSEKFILFRIIKVYVTNCQFLTFSPDILVNGYPCYQILMKGAVCVISFSAWIWVILRTALLILSSVR